MADDHEVSTREFVAALGRQDNDRIAELLADDVRWWVPKSAAGRHGLDYPLSGRDAVIAFLEGGQKGFEELSTKAEFVTAGNDGAAAVIEITGRLAGGGAYGPSLYGFFFRLQPDGRIVEVWETADTAAALEARADH
jgi:ketosteroid isomerase-like protein